MTTKTVEIHLPRPMEHQRAVLQSAARNKLLVCGRRWGKSTLGLVTTIVGHGPNVGDFRGAMQGGTIWYIAPTFPMASIMWRELKRSLKGAWESKSEIDRQIVLPGGGNIQVKSADHPDGLRGAGLDGAVLDEAAFFKPDAWTAIRPALADKQGWSMFLTTPKGMNWLWDTWDRAPLQEGWERWQRPSWDNPIMTSAEIEKMRAEMTPLEFRQEVEAEFVAGGGLVFHEEWLRYFSTMGDAVIQRVEGGNTYYVWDLQRFMTADLAISTKETADYTVFCVWGMDTEGNLYLLDIDRGRYEGPDQPPVAWKLWERWRPAYAAIESTQYQASLCQYLRRAGMAVKDLKADRDKLTRSKTATIKMKAGNIWLPFDHPLLRVVQSELLSFTGDSKQATHDDIVDNFSYAAIEQGNIGTGEWNSVYGVIRCLRCGTLYWAGDNGHRPCKKCGNRPQVVTSASA